MRITSGPNKETETRNAKTECHLRFTTSSRTPSHGGQYMPGAIPAIKNFLVHSNGNQPVRKYPRDAMN